MKIVVLDGYTLNPGDISWEKFESLGVFVCHDRTSKDKIIERIGDAEAVITNKTVLDKHVIDSCPSIKYIGVLATGYNVVDVEAAKARNITVTNIPAYSTPSVAQFVFALLLELCHHVGHHDATIKEGRWTKSPDFAYWDFPLVELSGKTMGIFGYGSIGQAVARIAVAMGMKVLACKRNPDKKLESEAIRFGTFEELLSESDVISLHAPLSESTNGIINSESIGRMKDGVFIINTARGGLVNEADMAAALAGGKVGGYAADVVSVEPITADNPLLGAVNCILTPHIAWAPKAARLRLMDIAAGNLGAFLGGRGVNVVSG